MPDRELLGLFLATWVMILPLYYHLGEIKSRLKSCPVCMRARAKKDLRDAEAEAMY
ncbi:MAG: hypothetical protein M8353_03200 [ANME-2 cluster archaeon]|nr:hypothetical protein [ANME-2 cluster archaeon]